MSAVFADTSFYVALLNPNDRFHQASRVQTQAITGPFITTEWVLLELANYLSKAHNRRLFVALLDDLKSDGRVMIVPSSPEVFEQGVTSYRNRPDKDWSLTDCISFVVMEQNRVRDALTVDHHFEQAGSRVLLK